MQGSDQLKPPKAVIHVDELAAVFADHPFATDCACRVAAGLNSTWVSVASGSLHRIELRRLSAELLFGGDA
jgi:hypothetical protein